MANHGEDMTRAMLQADIAQAREEFRALDRWHFQYQRRGAAYVTLSPAKEARLGDIADRIARLERFASCMAAKELLERDCS